METITSIPAVVSKAIWGDKTQEPVSGQQGKGNVNEPFDKGNDETGAPNTSTTAATTTTTTSDHNRVPDSGVDTSTNRTGPSEATSGLETGDPKSGQAPHVKQQGAANPLDAPSDHKPSGVPHTDEEREAAMAKGEFPRDPNDHSGEPLKMHLGGSDNQASTGLQAGSSKADRSKSVSQEGGTPHGKILGTGEQHVKTTGLAAEGGDFDATKPGAGVEASRILEQKGITHKTTPDKISEVDSRGSNDSETTKVSKMARLKEKLHIKK